MYIIWDFDSSTPTKVYLRKPHLVDVEKLLAMKRNLVFLHDQSICETFEDSEVSYKPSFIRCRLHDKNDITNMMHVKPVNIKHAQKH